MKWFGIIAQQRYDEASRPTKTEGPQRHCWNTHMVPMLLTNADMAGMTDVMNFRESITAKHHNISKLNKLIFTRDYDNTENDFISNMIQVTHMY